MNNNLLIFFIFWGVWILIPITVDGLYVLIQVITILIRGQRPSSQYYKISEEKMPTVSIIIPTYNEEKNVEECLNFLKIQTYPHEKIEIIVIDNGSSDKTGQIVREHINENTMNPLWNGHSQKIVHNDAPYEIKNSFKAIKLVTYHRQNKAHALNIGLERTTGDIIINIDCRARLHPEAIYNMAAKFVRERNLGACTGNVEITWKPPQSLNVNGRVNLNLNGEVKNEEPTLKQDFLAKCQFLEYLTSFRIGREFHNITRSMYTLSGAFSAFRRKAVGEARFYLKDNQDYLIDKNRAWYSDRTVTEDTDLTLALQSRRLRIGYAPYAKAYLKPVTSWQRLYAQRVRWRRGQIEVFGLHSNMLGNRKYGLFGSIFFPLTILIDHTLALPRLIWTSLFPFLIFFGYSPKIVFIAFLVMTLFHMGIDFFNVLICYPIVDKETKRKIRETLHYGFIISAFRFIVFYFRMSGFLIALRETPTWTITGGPIESIKKTSRKLNLFIQKLVLKFIPLNRYGKPRVKWQEKLLEKVFRGPVSNKSYPIQKLPFTLPSLSKNNSVDGIIKFNSSQK